MTRAVRSALAGIALCTLALVATAPTALAQEGGGGGGPDPTTTSAAERVSARVSPGIVYVQTQVHSWMRDLTTGMTLGPYDLTMQCTGFGVNSAGYIATAGHCVDREDIKNTLAGLVAASPEMAAGDRTAVYTDLMANWKLEGSAADSPPDVTTQVYRAGQPVDRARGMTAQIIDSQPNAKTDTALLKVDATDIPTIEVTPSDGVDTGAAITSIGFPSVRDGVVDPSLVPTFKSGTVSSRQARGAVPFLEISTDMGHGMSGGPTVDDRGRVVGVNSMGVGEDADAFNFVAPSSALLDMMRRNGVAPQAGPADLAYRAGLDAYYAGRYATAADDFGRVTDLQPDNRQAADLKAKAREAGERFGDHGGSAVLVWSLVGGGALLVSLGVVALVLVRRRRSGKPTATTSYGAGTPAPPSPPLGFPAPPASPSAAGVGEHRADVASGVATMPSPIATERTGRHCAQCGVGGQVNDRFCRGCGHEIG